MTGIRSDHEPFVYHTPIKPRTEYVCGFLFGSDGQSVALIRKNHPLWQARYLNGVGGKLEEGEIPGTAMTREFHEEAGLEIHDWAHFCTVRTVEARIHWFMHRLSRPLTLVQHAEPVQWYPIIALDTLDLIPNTRWLLVMAMVGPDGLLGNVWPYDIYEPSEGPK